MVTTVPIRKVDRWWFRVSPTQLACCRLETFFDPRGRYSLLITERSDNPGPSITDCHETLLREAIKWLGVAYKQCNVQYFEQYDRDSYAPPRDDRSEVCRVFTRGGKPHWEYVSEEEWEAIYHAPRAPKVEIKIRRKAGA